MVADPARMLTMRRRMTGRRMPTGAAFWMLGALFAVLLLASSAPSPLYPVYQAAWHFSAVTLTVVFAVYAFALLVALLVAGSISDHVGRRPVLLVSLPVQAVAMVLFAEADGVGSLVAARVLQGLATGVAVGTLSAALIDLQPVGRPNWGSLATTVAPSAGLAAGALGAGVAVQYGPAPRQLIFWLLMALFVAGALATAVIPETVPFDRGWAASLVPKVAVPRPARAAFLAVSPGVVAAWALGGLYLSLGSSLAISLLHSRDRVASSLPIVALTGVSTVTAVLTRGWPARRAMLGGTILLAVGVGGTLAGVAGDRAWPLIAGSAVAGLGWGPAFAGALRTVTPLVRPAERAGLLAAVYVLSYLAFSLPAVAAGFAVTRIGLRDTADIYGAAVIVLALLAVAAFAWQASRRAPVRAGPAGAVPPARRAGPEEPDECVPCPGTVPAYSRAGRQRQPAE